LHRDVNPSNLLIAAHDHGLQLTLIDCTSAWPTNVFPQVPIGNPAFTPPEQMEGHACKQSDWYSLAATCFFAANGEAPVLAQQERLLAGLRNTHILDEMEFEGSKRADDYGLLASLLEARPENRPQKYFTLKPKTGTRMAPSRFESLDSVMDLGVAGNVFIPGTGSYGQSWEAVPASKLAKVVARAREQLQIEGRQMQEFLAAQMREKAAN
jgi:serine/threonine protein kinase